MKTEMKIVDCGFFVKPVMVNKKTGNPVLPIIAWDEKIKPKGIK